MNESDINRLMDEEERLAEEFFAHEKKKKQLYNQSRRVLNNTKKRNRRLYIIHTKGGKCECCNATESLQIHHKIGVKKYEKDWMNEAYNLDNLKVLCANCHVRIHKTEDGKDEES